MDTKLSEELTNDIFTIESLDIRLEELKEASRWIYKAGKKPLSSKLAGRVSEGFLAKIKSLEEKSLLPANLKQQTELFKQARIYLSSLPVCKITLAFDSSEEFKKRLAETINDYIGRRAILDISKKEEIVGGLVIEFEGEYRDYSVGRNLFEVINKLRLK